MTVHIQACQLRWDRCAAPAEVPAYGTMQEDKHLLLHELCVRQRLISGLSQLTGACT